jgi:hypothetical protein
MKELRKRRPRLERLESKELLSAAFDSALTAPAN